MVEFKYKFRVAADRYSSALAPGSEKEQVCSLSSRLASVQSWLSKSRRNINGPPKHRYHTKSTRSFP
eukprot:2826864-Rhodomonas_salina.6